MKAYRNVVLALSIFLGVAFMIFLQVCSPMLYLAINEPVTEDYYQLMKQNARTIAESLDKTVLTDETLTANFYFNEDELVVIIESLKAKLTAKFPVSEYSKNMEDANISIRFALELENVEYEEETRLQPVWYYFALAILGGITVSIILYALFFGMWASPFKLK